MAMQFATPAAATSAPVSRQDRPKATVWLNIGITVPMTNETTGEVEDTFVSLPIGLPVDTMEAQEMKGNNPNWANLVQAKNWLLNELQTMSKGIKPGQSELIEGLQIQIRHTGSAAVPAPGDNPLLAAMAGKLNVVK